MALKNLAVTAASCLVIVSLAACGGQGAASGTSGGNSLTFVSSGGAFQDAQKKAWQEPFTASNGTKFTNDGPVDEPKLKAMVDAKRVTWDVMDLSAGPTEQYCGKYLENLDFSVIDKSLYPAETVNDCGVPAYYYSQMFLYNTEKFGSKPPTKASDFFDLVNYPGQRIVPPELSVGLLEFALLADGVPADKLYPLDVDRALKKLDPIKSHITFATTYGQIQQALVGKQVDMALSLTARTILSVREGAPYDVVWDKTIVNWDTLSIPKGSANKDLAMKFIASTAAKDRQAEFAKLASNIPVSSDVKPDYDDVQKRLDPFATGHKDSLVYANPKWWGENLDTVTAKFTAWKVG
ncbi:polyamine ABC transporter substrate-binding protein [Paenarthrobacter ureafaciens]|jgi:putative spermidine/putrescine transport system substrate-binding protein|uniref:polyamine ABC transporter substrate-binding protein n=1 Tax=Paenarthrobacter ureafaciens TaxID=37931 RepID=UPI001C2BC081|nr:ABC transporter substrate-binding protein [Paenarthrobacter ureafaciens]